ncbi:hypothetical protein RND81_11G105100 [Saponaria officinalis]|uniref:Reticulon-like protein n=1 Tax=Saponaria officinalis TaxID=3572 RepID=A0AAW1HLE9_SAPOF
MEAKTPPTNKKSAPRLLIDEQIHEIPHFEVEIAPSPSPSPSRPKKSPLSSSASKLLVNKSRGCLPMHELLLNLSPSPVRKSRTRVSDRLELAEDDLRRKCKGRSSGNGLSGCFSPRNLRRSRRRIEMDEREIVGFEEVVKPRKRRISGKSKKEKANSVNFAVCSKDNDGGESALERIRLMIWDLVMWNDVAKSSLWFGFGCLCFLSSCFTKGLSISLFSVISQLGLVFLAVSFISNTLHQRENVPEQSELCLKEEDILKVIRAVLPALNLSISKARELFSGEPSMTLKVASFFLFGAEYGHFLTIWRLCVLGFFISFTAPKLYSSYAAQIDNKVEQYKSIAVEAWRACYHKKIVAASAATIFWNMSCLKTRVFAAFIALVIFRYYRQHSDSIMEEDTVPKDENLDLQGNPTIAEEPAKETLQQALVVADQKSDK